MRISGLPRMPCCSAQIGSFCVSISASHRIVVRHCLLAMMWGYFDNSISSDASATWGNVDNVSFDAGAMVPPPPLGSPPSGEYDVFPLPPSQPQQVLAGVQMGSGSSMEHLQLHSAFAAFPVAAVAAAAPLHADGSREPPVADRGDGLGRDDRLQFAPALRWHAASAMEEGAMVRSAPGVGMHALAQPGPAGIAGDRGQLAAAPATVRQMPIRVDNVVPDSPSGGRAPGMLVAASSADASPGAASLGTPDGLQRKDVSPGDKTCPYGAPAAQGPQAARRIADPVVEVRADVKRHLDQLLDADWSGVLQNDAALRVLFDYDAIYGILGSSPQSMESAVYSLFVQLFKDYRSSKRFSFPQAYKMYQKFPVEAITTRVSATAYRHLGDLLRVDPNFVRFPKIGFQKSLMPADFVVRQGSHRKSMRENILMVAGGGLKKSYIIKMLRGLLRNMAQHDNLPGIFETLQRHGFCRKKNHRYSERARPRDGELVGDEEPPFFEQEDVWVVFLSLCLADEDL